VDGFPDIGHRRDRRQRRANGRWEIFDEADLMMNMWRSRPVAIGLAMAAGLASIPMACQERSEVPGSPATRPAKTVYDDDYIDALSAANKFCQAWRQADYAAGKKLLSRRLARAYSDKRLQDAIAGLSNPRHAAIEIFEGQKLPDGRFAFKIRLFHRYTGVIEDRIEAPVERIVMVRRPVPDRPARWLVDEFPIP